MTGSYQIITNDIMLNDFLVKNKKDCKTIDELFPLGGKEFLRLQHEANNLIQNYKKYFDKLTYESHNIFLSLEPVLLNDAWLYLQLKKILELKQNTIFLLRGYSFAFFVVKNYAKNLGFDEIKIQEASTQKEYSYQNSNTFIKNYQRKLFFLKSISNRNQNITKFQLPLLMNTAFFKFFQIFSINSVGSIIKKCINKIESSEAKFTAKSVFVITPSSDYIYFPFYSVINKFSKESIPFQVFVFDLLTDSILLKYGVNHINFSEETYAISEIIKKSKEGKKFYTEFVKITKENNLEIIWNNGLLNPVVQKIYSSLAIMIICNSLFQKMKLKSVIPILDGTVIGNTIVSVSKKIGIPTFSIISFGIQPSPIEARYRADFFCVYGKQAFETLASLGYKKNNILLTGNPRYDNNFNLDANMAKKYLQNDFGIDPNKKLIVVGFGKWYANDEIWISKLIRFCNENNFEIIIKVKPLDMPGAKDNHILMTKLIQEKCKNFHYLITIDADTSKLLAAANLLITGHSNLAVEAAVLQKPTIFVNFINEPSRMFSDFVDFSNSFYVEEYQSLEKCIKEILIENKHSQRLENSRNYITNNFNIYNDGNASERIIQILTDNQKLEKENN